jgi:uncharacterized membrane protein
MTAAVTSIARASAPRWMAIALLASVALNLVVVGATATSLWRHHLQSELAVAPAVAPNLLGYASTLPPERRKALWQRTEEERRIVRPLRRELREARDEMLKVVAAETFDRERYQATQARLLTADQKAREAVHKLYAEIAAGLTNEERVGYLRWREMRRPKQNLLDEPDHQANDRSQN